MDISERLNIPEHELAALCRRYHVRELAIFGSALRGDFSDESDVDILVEFEPGAPIGFVAYQEFRDELTKLVGRPVDLVSKRGLNPLLEATILESSQVLYAR